jgi:hypothetical protein
MPLNSLITLHIKKNMEIKSTLPDRVVQGTSFLLEMSIGEYIAIAKVIIDRNEFQRRRVKSSKTTYSLLRRDIERGCVLPPLVLAHRDTAPGNVATITDLLKSNPDQFIILDGLQRSFTLIDISNEIDGNELEDFLGRGLRCEIYDGVNRAGILYRMLTLNTGQTTMSLRHQIEIMYLDYLTKEVEGVRLIREVDDASVNKLNEYNFREMIEGFNSYIDRNELPMDRADVLDNISSLENLSTENNDADLFAKFLKTWHSFILAIDQLNIEAEKDPDTYHDNLFEAHDEDSKNSFVWGGTGVRIFKRPQAVSGFGAAIGMLRDESEFEDFSNIHMNFEVGAEPHIFILAFNEAIQNINKNARKIGNAQRLFFRMYFKMLFMKDSTSYKNLYKSISLAQNGAERLGI